MNNKLVEKSTGLVGRARAVKIIDQTSYEEAAEFLKGTTALKQEIQAHYGPMKQASHKAWQNIIRTEKGMLAPVTETIGILKTAMAAYLDEQQRLRREEERLLAEAAREIEEDRRLAAAVEAEARGASEAEVSAVLDRPTVVPMVQVQAPKPVEGVSQRTSWRAEVTDLRALARAVADGGAPENAIEPHMPTLNRLAQSMRSAMSIPGVRAVSRASMAVRS